MTIYEIAELSGVSIATVSRVLNGFPGISERTRTQVLSVIEKTGYTLNSTARDLSTRQSRMVGMVLPGVNSYFSPAVEAVSRALRKNLNSLLIVSNPSGVFNASEEVDSLRLLLSKRVQGVIMFVSRLTEEHSKVFEKWPKDVALVLINEDLTAQGFSCVLQDPEPGLRQLFGRLASLGKKKLAFVDGPSFDRSAQERKKVSRKLMAEFGLVTKPAWELSGGFDLKSGREATLGLLKKPRF